MPYIAAEVCPVKPKAEDMYWPQPDPTKPRPQHKNKLVEEFLQNHAQNLQDRSMSGLVPLPRGIVDIMSSSRFQLGRVNTLRRTMDDAVKTDAAQSPYLPSVDLATQSTGHVLDAIGQLGILADYIQEDLPKHIEVIARASESAGLQLMAEHVQATHDTQQRRVDDLECAVAKLTDLAENQACTIKMLEHDRTKMAQCIQQHELRNKGRKPQTSQLETDYAKLAADYNTLEKDCLQLRHRATDPNLVYRQFLANLVNQVNPQQYKDATDYLNAILAQNITHSPHPYQRGRRH